MPVAAGLPRVWHVFGEDGLPQRLLLLAKMIDRVTSRQLQAEFGLSVAQWRVLAFISISGPATASLIGEAAEVDQAEVSRAVRALLKRGFLSRDYAPGSRKKMVISPTDEGEELFRRVRQRRRDYFARITARLDQHQRADFENTMAVIGATVVADRAGAV